MPDRLSPTSIFQRSGAQRVMKFVVMWCCLAVTLLVVTLPLPAQQAAAGSPSSSSSSAKSELSKELSDKLAQLDQRVTAAQSAGDNAWMLVSAALVLMMTGPGLALFYGGLVRRKN